MFWDNIGSTINVVDKYLNWKWASDTWYFTYYDKEVWEEKKYELSEFVLLRKAYTIKWWSDEFNKPIYSNKIDRFDEVLNVKTWDTTIVKWIYKDIKWDLAWWKLYIVLTVLHNWEVLDIPVKWMDFFELNEVLKWINTNNNKIKFIEAKEWEKWVVKFKTPVFWLWWEIIKEEKDMWFEVVKVIKEWLQVKEEFETIEEEIKKMDKIEEEISIEDIPF